MDLNSLMSESPKLMTVFEAIKKDPDFLNELKANPQEALNKIGVELNQEELEMVQKLESFEEAAAGIFDKVKGFFGINDEDTH